MFPPAVSSMATESRLIRSFDSGENARACVARPDRYGVFSGPLPLPGPPIARGSGLSYAAASFADGGCAVDMRRFDRLLAFDPVSGEVVVEAGVTLFQLHRFLMRHGRYLPVQPGYGNLSIGGCIAADTHGKNQARDGNFHSQVLSLRLFHPAHGMVEVDASHEPDVFAASCGCFGLTGIIVAARLRSAPLPGHLVSLQATQVGSPAESAALMQASVTTDDILYSWHDFTRPGGPGLVFRGRFLATQTHEATAREIQDLRVPPASGHRLPMSVYHPAVVRLLNRLHARGQRRRPHRTLDATQALFPVHGRTSYFGAFGPRGFHEFQALVPDVAFPSFITEVQALVRSCEATVTLASGKAFGGGEGFLRFAGQGSCFAVNMPRGPAASRLLPLLDDALIAHGGRPNIIKDSRLPQRVVAACYPEYERLREVLRSWDPARLFSSALSRRIGL